MLHKALFLDRDGVINHDDGYTHKAEQVHFIPGIFELCKAAKERGYLVVVVTNQAGIGRGYYSEEQFHTLMEWMKERFLEQGCCIDAVYHCPFHPEHGVGDYKCESPDRKPEPGMLLRAAKDLSIDLAQSVLVGDKESDMLAGKRAGLSKLYLYGNEPTKEEWHRVSDLIAAIALL